MGGFLGRVVLVDLDPHYAIPVGGEGEGEGPGGRFLIFLIRVGFSGDELGDEIAIGDGDVGGEEGGGAGLPGTGALAEGGLVTVPELLLLP